ncbi:MAG: CBS domain-containing protein [Candidatus Aminicenantes bacterium]|nr:CBS domain-containing protein [Candidatus Aminicenantes bacterium]
MTMANNQPEKVLEEPGLKMFVYLSRILDRAVINAEGRSFGKLADLKVRMGELFPRMSSLVIKPRRKKKPLELDWAQVDSVTGSRIVLRPGAEEHFHPLQVGPDELLIREELLDKQVVDTFGAKIERVNDIHLLGVNKDLHIVHVDFGLRGLIRRLGWLKAVDAFTGFFFSFQIKEKLISWKYIQPLVSDLRNQDLKLNVAGNNIRDLHPSELADILEELDRGNRDRLFKSLDVETAAETLEEVDPRLQVRLLEAAPAESASDILEEMAPDEATDLLFDLPEEQKQNLIRTMEKPSRDALVELLRHKEGTAGSLMTKDYISLDREQTIGQAIEEFRKTTYPLDSVSYIYVTDNERRLLGVSTLRHLIICDKSTPVAEFMNPRLITVEPGQDIEDVVKLFKKYKFMALPVVDRDDRLQGIITLKDIIQETLED